MSFEDEAINRMAVACEKQDTNVLKIDELLVTDVDRFKRMKLEYYEGIAKVMLDALLKGR